MMEIDLPEIDEEELEKIKVQKTKEVLEDAEIAEMIALNALTPEFVKKNVYFSVYINATRIFARIARVFPNARKRAITCRFP